MNSLICPGWTGAVWDIGNGYIFQYHFSILDTDTLCVFTINQSIKMLRIAYISECIYAQLQI